MKIKYIILLLLFVNCNNKNERTNFSQKTISDIIKKEEVFLDTLGKKDEVKKMLLSFYSEWLKSLEIKKIDNTHYSVLFLDGFTNEFITINLTITKENQSYKIDNVEY